MEPIFKKENVQLFISDFNELKNLDKESIKMGYLDPPFNSNRNYKLSSNDNTGFNDKWETSEYEKIIKNLVDVMYDLIQKDGTLFFHISADQTSYTRKILRKNLLVKPIFLEKMIKK